MLQQAIDTYHDLLNPDFAAETQAQLERVQRDRGLYFGDRPLVTVLRPRFLSWSQYRFLQSRSALLLGAFERAYTRAVADAEFRAQFHLADWEEQLIGDEPGYANPSPTARLDAFFTSEKGGLRLTEYNAETPAALGYNDLLSEMFMALPAMREFGRMWEVLPLPARHGVLHTLLETYRQWSGRREQPNIGILDWKEVPTYSEFLIFQDYFRSNGFPCTIADPREVEYRDGRLMAGDFHITLIYKRVLLHELVEQQGLDGPVMRAVRDRAVCMANGPRCKILHKKASLAVLSDEANADLFSEQQLAAIESHIPWTRVVQERRTTCNGRGIDLVSWIHENRERLVLKPNDDYGGRGIVLGWTVEPDVWARAVQTALSEPYIVQDRIILPTEPYPSIVDGRVEITERMQDTAPFVMFGQYVEGCLTRLATDPLLNVTAGGGSSVPTMLVEKR